jgi:hypothetical protein
MRWNGLAVFDSATLAGTSFIPFEINNPEQALMASSAMAAGDPAVIVPPPGSRQRLHQRPQRLLGRDFLKGRKGLKTSSG